MQQTYEIDFTGVIFFPLDCNNGNNNKKWITLNKIFEYIYETEFVKNIIEGKDFIQDTMYTKYDHIDIEQDFECNITKDNYKNNTNEEILSLYIKLINGGETNELFKKAFNKLINLIKNDESFKKYTLYDLFYLLTKLRCFSYLGREDFYIYFNETDNFITLKMNLIQPSLDDIDYVSLKKKIVKIIYNKTTGLYLKIEFIDDDFYLYNYVYNYETGDCFIRSESKIVNKDYIYWWLGNSTIYYIKNGYYIKREDVQYTQLYYCDEKTDKEHFGYKNVICYMYKVPNE